MLHAVFLCFAVQAMAASDGWGGADMQLIYHPGLAMRSLQVGFKGKEMPITKTVRVCIEGLKPYGDVDAPGDTVYDLAWDQVLAGYRYLPQVSEPVRQDPVSREHGVREFICSQERFASEVLWTCVDTIIKNLQKDQGAACVRKHLGWRDWPVEDIKESVYPASGCTRLWRAIPATNVTRVSRKNRVCIAFRGEDVALEGVLAPQAASFYSAVKADSLWTLKCEEKPQPQPPVCAQRPDAASKLSDFLNSAGSSKYDIGILYCSLSGVCYGALVASADVSMNVSYGRGIQAEEFSVPIVESLQRELLRGFVLKNKKASSKKNAAVLRRPEIRDVACERTPFASRALDGFLDLIQLHWGREGFISTEQDAFWKGLRKEHLTEAKGLHPCVKEWSWSIVSQEDMDTYLEKEQKKYAVFILCRGAGVGVKGHPGFLMPEPPDRASLKKYVVRAFLKNHTTQSSSPKA